MPDLILVQTRPTGLQQEANPGSLLIPAAYVVFYDPVSATTFGRNGKTAKLDQYNSDSATVFNAVLQVFDELDLRMRGYTCETCHHLRGEHRELIVGPSRDGHGLIVRNGGCEVRDCHCSEFVSPLELQVVHSGA